MAKKKKKVVSLRCSECKRANYHYLAPKKGEQNKFCNWSKKHLKHKESKKA